MLFCGSTPRRTSTSTLVSTPIITIVVRVAIPCVLSCVDGKRALRLPISTESVILATSPALGTSTSDASTIGARATVQRRPGQRHQVSRRPRQGAHLELAHQLVGFPGV